MKVNYEEILSNPEMFELFKRSTIKERNETLSCVYESIKKCLEKKNAYNERLHAALFIGLCECLGGQQVYLPTSKYLFKVMNHILIYKEFNGKNTNELSLKYKISPRSIADIIARQRKFEKLARDSLESVGIKHV